MLTSNTILAVFFALMFLVALLMLAGPTRVSKDHHRQWCDVVSVLLCDCLRCSNYGKAAKMSHKKKKYAVDDDSEGKSVDLPVSRQSRRVTTAKVSAVGSSGAPLPRSQSKNMTSLPPLPAGNHPDEVGIEMMTNPHVESLRGRGPKEDSAELI